MVEENVLLPSANCWADGKIRGREHRRMRTATISSLVSLHRLNSTYPAPLRWRRRPRTRPLCFCVTLVSVRIRRCSRPRILPSAQQFADGSRTSSTFHHLSFLNFFVKFTIKIPFCLNVSITYKKLQLLLRGLHCTALQNCSENNPRKIGMDWNGWNKSKCNLEICF